MPRVSGKLLGDAEGYERCSIQREREAVFSRLTNQTNQGQHTSVYTAKAQGVFIICFNAIRRDVQARHCLAVFSLKYSVLSYVDSDTFKLVSVDLRLQHELC